MRELLVSSGDAGEDGFRQGCDYYIVIDQMDVDGAFACESYGVRVVGPGGDEAVIPHITIDIARIDELVELLRRNEVTPTALRDVVDDWL